MRTEPAASVSGTTAPVELLASACGRQATDLAVLLNPLPLSALDALTMGDLLMLSGRADDPHLTMALAWLFTALGEGSVCLLLTASHCGPYPSSEQREAVGRHLAAFLDNLAAGRYDGLIDETPASGSAPLVWVRSDAASGRPDLLYFQRFFRHEAGLKTRLEAFLARPEAPLCAPERIQAHIDALWQSERVIRLGDTGRPLAADHWQRAALHLVMTRSFAVVSGGPGTGKTSLMVNMLRLLVACGIDTDEVRLAAPTGRAAQRMREALQGQLAGIAGPTAAETDLMTLEAHTLHRLLRYQRRQGGFYHHAGRPIPARAVVVDEVSMIDVEMLDRLLQAIDPARTRLILLGDKDQLPSVQAGAVFAEMVPAEDAAGTPAPADSDGEGGHRFSDHLVVLRTSYRVGDRLRRFAARVNQGHLPALQPVSLPQALRLSPDSFAWIGGAPRESARGWLEEVCSQWSDHHYRKPLPGGRDTYLDIAAKLAGHAPETLEAGTPSEVAPLGGLFAALGQARVLTLTRHGPLGCVALNRLMLAHLAGHLGRAVDPGTGLFSGAPVLVTRNDYARRLFNGDVGIALRDAQGRMRIYVQRGRDLIGAPIETLTDWEPAFATTVHKSQGSEFDHVLLVFPDDPRHRLLSREIFYTGVTRARKRLILLARIAVLQEALSRRIQRRSGLGWSS